ncbi:MAG: hypothetical protein GY765_11625 [bacterium]|nr:hypothetical protein [bacterium]
MTIVNATSKVNGMVNVVVVPVAIIISIILLLLIKLLRSLNLTQHTNGLVSNHTSFGSTRYFSNSSCRFTS